MKIFKTFATSVMIMALFATSCKENKQYTLTGQFDDNYNDATVLLISLSSGDTLATTEVQNGTFNILGEAVNPDLAQLRIGGRAVGMVILEPGVIVITKDGVQGTALNQAMSELHSKVNETLAYIKNNVNDSTKTEELEVLQESLQAQSDSIMLANIDNPIGASIMIDAAYDMSKDSLENIMNQHPSLKSYARLNKILDQKTIAEETSEGKHYKDFEVSYEGNTTKLSDLMHPDHYTLVDFWASWCGPCRKEIPVIKEIQEEWGPKGLDVVGVAVWDEPENTVKAIDQLGINWPVIIDAQRIPTDIYGILSIPCIILIGPDGTILSRGLGGDELKAAVSAAMTK